MEPAQGAQTEGRPAVVKPKHTVALFRGLAHLDMQAIDISAHLHPHALVLCKRARIGQVLLKPPDRPPPDDLLRDATLSVFATGVRMLP
jgi:hypothetical protein